MRRSLRHRWTVLLGILAMLGALLPAPHSAAAVPSSAKASSAAHDHGGMGHGMGHGSHPAPDAVAGTSSDGAPSPCASHCPDCPAQCPDMALCQIACLHAAGPLPEEDLPVAPERGKRLAAPASAGAHDASVPPPLRPPIV